MHNNYFRPEMANQLIAAYARGDVNVDRIPDDVYLGSMYRLFHGDGVQSEVWPSYKPDNCIAGFSGILCSSNRNQQGKLLTYVSKGT